ncbi:MAG: hypothetical protein WC069_01795 [Candidatus Shapirobacteria bacterium]
MNENIKIDIKIKDRGNLLANANLSIMTKDFGWINIRDFIIWSSNNLNIRLNEKINIQPLSVNIHGKYHAKVFIENPSDWEKMEKEIYQAYKEKLLEGTPIEEEAVNGKIYMPF